MTRVAAQRPLMVATSREDGHLVDGWNLEQVTGVLVKPFERESLLAQLARAGAEYQARHRPRPLAVVIDDSVAATTVLAHMLEGQGFDVETATSGAQGLELVEWMLPNLVLCDVEMPGLSGLDVCASLSANAATRDVPVVLISATVDPVVERHGHGRGAIDFLPKPVDERRLALVVKARMRWGAFRPRAGALVLEDEKVAAMLARRVLSELAVVAHVCPTVADLELHLSIGTPTLLVLDRELPDGSGIAVCRRLRANRAYDRVPIVMTSATSDLVHRRECLSAGADDFLAKPFTRHDLGVRLTPLLGLDTLAPRTTR